MGTTFTKKKDENDSCASSVPPLKCTACLDDLCPKSIDASLAVWHIADFENAAPPASPRFNISTTSASSPIHVFVSHTWYDQVFVNGMKMLIENRNRAQSLPPLIWSIEKRKVETIFYDLKCTGLLKGVRQLALRKIHSPDGSVALPDDVKQWRIWMDLVCIDQYNQNHKAHVTRLLKDYIREAMSMVIILSPAYFTRLWCVFEYCCFLAFNDMSRIAVYAWGFCDKLTVAKHERDTAPAAIRALASSLPESLRAFSVQSSQCSFDCDKILLREKVLDLYLNPA